MCSERSPIRYPRIVARFDLLLPKAWLAGSGRVQPFVHGLGNSNPLKASLTKMMLLDFEGGGEPVIMAYLLFAVAKLSLAVLMNLSLHLHLLER